MKFAVLTATLAASASAFAPAQSNTRVVTSLNAERSKSLPFMNRPDLVSTSLPFVRASLRMAMHPSSISLYTHTRARFPAFVFLQLDGSMAGDVGFDPLGLSTIEGVGVDLYWLREAEIKHCRVAMMAVAGVLWVELFGPAPGCEMATAKSQTDAFWQLWQAHPQYIAFGFIMTGLVEMITGIAITTGRESGQRAPGDFGLDPLKIKNNPAKWEKYSLNEVKNGRLAMFAAAGQLMQSWTTHEGAFENLSATFN
jgi:light-harvesting complex I chlorophyll a/b binding protein 1